MSLARNAAIAKGGTVADRRSILVGGARLAGAAALMPCIMGPAASAVSNPEAAGGGDDGAARLAQAGEPGSRAGREGRFADCGKSTARLAGSPIHYAYAVKAGPWVFLNGHEAYRLRSRDCAGGRGTARPLV